MSNENDDKIPDKSIHKINFSKIHILYKQNNNLQLYAKFGQHVDG